MGADDVPVPVHPPGLVDEREPGGATVGHGNADVDMVHVNIRVASDPPGWVDTLAPPGLEYFLRVDVPTFDVGRV